MTKIQLTYTLVKPLNEKNMEGIARAHSVYGILRVTVSPKMDSIMVEYDATRLNPLEVESVLHRSGIPIVLKQQQA